MGRIRRHGRVPDGLPDRSPDAARLGNATGATSDLRVRKCGVQEEVDGPYRPTLFISPALDAAEAHHVPPSFKMAPFCDEPRPRAELE